MSDGAFKLDPARAVAGRAAFDKFKATGTSMTERESEDYMHALCEAAQSLSGRIEFSLSFTPTQVTLDSRALDADGNVIAEPEMNPFVAAHVVAWALKLQFTDIHAAAMALLQRAMQGEMLQRREQLALAEGVAQAQPTHSAPGIQQ